MTAELVKFPGTTTLPLSVRAVLDAAPDELKIALVLGLQEDNSLYFAGTSSDLGEVLLLLERAKVFVVRMAVENAGQRHV